MASIPVLSSFEKAQLLLQAFGLTQNWVDLATGARLDKAARWESAAELVEVAMGGPKYRLMDPKRSDPRKAGPRRPPTQVRR